MKIDTKYKPEVLVWNPKDHTRPNVEQPFLDGDVVVATNGRALVRLPVSRDEGDKDGRFPGAALVDARKQAKAAKVDRSEIRLNGAATLANAATYPRDTSIEPLDWKHVVPAFKPGDEGTASFVIDTGVLAGLLKALGADGDHVLITVKLPEAGKEMLDIILVHPRLTALRNPALKSEEGGAEKIVEAVGYFAPVKVYT